MNIIWDEEEREFIESWAFEEWFKNQANRPSPETLEVIKQFEYHGEESNISANSAG